MKKKIKALFEYRVLPSLIKEGKIKKGKKLFKKLIQLQIEIYHLDAYLEANWKIKTSELTKRWKKIHQAMLACGVSKDKLEEYSKHILKYQKHELDLRLNKLPIDGSTEYYYYYKSCDVRLMRQIIYDHAPDLSQRYTMADWRYFDLITELNDDVEDMFEDLETINGNWVLINVFENGKRIALTETMDFIQLLKEKNQERFVKRSSESKYKKIDKLTKVQIKATKKLLKKNFKKIKSKKVSKGILFRNLS